jgi:hypothetical protein
MVKQRTGHEGRNLESLILASQGGVLLTKIPFSAKRLPGGHIVACCGPCDFFGIHIPSGRMLVFDGKQSKNPHRLPTGEKEFREHQRLELIRYHDAGAISGLLCESTATGRLYWCSARRFLTRAPSIPWEDMIDIGPATHTVEWGRIVEAYRKNQSTTSA